MPATSNANKSAASHNCTFIPPFCSDGFGTVSRFEKVQQGYRRCLAFKIAGVSCCLVTGLLAVGEEKSTALVGLIHRQFFKTNALPVWKSEGVAALRIVNGVNSKIALNCAR